MGGVCYRGSQDDALTPQGWKQMWCTVGTNCPWNYVVSSPLTRCAEFAHELARSRLLPIVIDERLREMHFGEWEGRRVAELLATDRDRVTKYWSDPAGHAPPGAEPFYLFQTRVLTAWDELISRQADAHLLIVSHGGPIRVILGHVLGMQLQALLRLEVSHADLSRVRVDVDSDGRRFPRLVFHAGRL